MAVKIAEWLRRIAEWLDPTQDSVGSRVVVLLRDPVVEAILKAVNKQETDPVLKTATSNVKRNEALEWAERYAQVADQSAPRDAWKTRVLLELLVGTTKGKL